MFVTGAALSALCIIETSTAGTDDSDEAALQEVFVVTGSLNSRANNETPRPVQVLSATMPGCTLLDARLRRVSTRLQANTA
jgi:hypothetical protein